MQNIGSGNAYQISGPALEVFKAHTYAEIHPGIHADPRRSVASAVFIGLEAA